MTAYVIVREICDEFSGTFTTVLGVALTEGRPGDIVALAELELETAINFGDVPLRPDVQKYYTKNVEFLTHEWDKAINDWLEKCETYKESLLQIMTVDPDLGTQYLCLKDDRIHYSYEEVQFYTT